MPDPQAAISIWRHAGRHGFARWRGLFAPLLDAVPAPGARPDGFYADVCAVPLGVALLVKLRITGAVLRSPDPASGGLDHLLVWCGEAGALKGTTSAGSLALAAGDLATIDLLAPFALEAADHDASILVIPRDLALARGWDVAQGRRFCVGAPLTALVAAHLGFLVANAAAMSLGERAAAVTSLLALVASGAPQDTGQGPARPPGTRARILASMARDLSDPGLTPARLAAGCGISRMGVYRAFSAEGGVVAALRRLRLERALSILVDPARDGMPVAQVATEVGFVSPAHFARDFRRRFGVTPSAVRGGGATPAHGLLDARLRLWVEAVAAEA